MFWYSLVLNKQCRLPGRNIWVRVSFGRSLCRYSPPFHAVKKWHCMFRRERVDVLVFSGRSGPPA